MSSWSESLRMNQVRVVRSLIAAFRDCGVGGRVVDGEARYVEVARRRDAGRRLAASSAGLLAVCSWPLRTSMIEHTIMRGRTFSHYTSGCTFSRIRPCLLLSVICDDKARAIILPHQSNYRPIRKNGPVVHDKLASY